MKILFFLFATFVSIYSWSNPDLKIGDFAPTFKAKMHNGSSFDLQSRRGQWTVLYFYPKASTPGCTVQAHGFRDHIEQIRSYGAEVFGVSVDSVADQKSFHETENLNFNLIADEKGEVVSRYGSKMPIMNMSKRWTFLIDPQLKIRVIEKDVDAKDNAQEVIAELKKINPKKN